MATEFQGEVVTDFWDGIENSMLTNEADVEHLVVLPLLRALNYSETDIAPKFPVVFREGRTGRRPEADFVVFYGPEHSKDNSLITIEAKAPHESFKHAKDQAESYAQNIRTPFYVITDGLAFELWQLQPSTESECVVRCSLQTITAHRATIEACLTKDAAYAYCTKLRRKSAMSVVMDLTLYVTHELARIKQITTQSIDRYVPRSRSRTLNTALTMCRKHSPRVQ